MIEISSGPLQVNLPTDPKAYAPATGGIVSSFFDDFYNRIHIVPSSTDFGPVTTETSVQVNLWNAYYKRNVTLLAINYDTMQGLSVLGQEPPNTFLPMQTKIYSVAVSVDGVAMIDTSVNWTFDLPWSFEMAITGTREKLWTFDPMWPPTGQSYQITYEFKTEITTSRSGREFRSAQRRLPRKRIAFRTLLHGEKFRQFKDLMWSWQHNAFLAPELTRFVSSVAPMGAGSTFLQIDQNASWLIPGATVILDYMDKREIRTIEAVEDGSVEFKASTPTVWPAGTRLYYCLTGYTNTQLDAGRLTNAAAEVEVEFEVAPLSEPIRIVPDAPHTFNGRELFLKRPNWAHPVDVSMSREIETLDYGRGPVFRFQPVEFGTEARKATYLNRNATEADQIVDFFFRMKGRQGEFYMPTWEYDFIPKGVTQAVSSGMRVAGGEFATMYGNSTVHRAMFVMMANGDLLFRRVTAVSQVNSGDQMDSMILVDQPWGREISKDNIVMCGWMPVWRFVSDNLTMEWLTGRVAQVALNMMTLEDLPVETA